MKLMELGAPGEFRGCIGVRLRSSSKTHGAVASGRTLTAALCLCCLLGAIAPVQGAGVESHLVHYRDNLPKVLPCIVAFQNPHVWRP